MYGNRHTINKGDRFKKERKKEIGLPSTQGIVEAMSYSVEKKEKKKKERKKEIGLPSTQGIVEVMSSSVDCSGPFPHEFWREFFALSSYNAKS